jgi:hypothetical protein
LSLSPLPIITRSVSSRHADLIAQLNFTGKVC